MVRRWLMIFLATGAVIASVYMMDVSCAGNAPAAGERIAAPVFYKDQVLVLAASDGVAAVAFGKESDQGVTYRFRYLPADGGKEETGKGKVFEKYKRVPAANGGGVQVVDMGSELTIKAGPIHLEWSLYAAGKGWIYYQPEDVRVQIAAAEQFDKLDLQRFAK